MTSVSPSQWPFDHPIQLSAGAGTAHAKATSTPRRVRIATGILNARRLFASRCDSHAFGDFFGLRAREVAADHGRRANRRFEPWRGDHIAVNEDRHKSAEMT